jgi:hypothetical protein
MLRRDDDDGDALVARGDHAGEQIRRAGTGVAKDGSHLAGRLVQPFRHVHRGGLVPDRYESHLVLLQLGEQRVDFRTRDSKHELDALADQTSQQKLCSGNFTHKILLCARRLAGIEAIKQSKQKKS